VREIVFGIFGIAAALALLVAIAAWIPRGPMNHGRDSPWHDWWHSAPSLQHGRAASQETRCSHGLVMLMGVYRRVS